MLFFNRSKVKIILEVFIVCLGLTRFIADTFQFKKIDAISFAFGASPLPLVFSDREGVEDFAHQTKIIAQGNDQIAHEKVFDKHAFRNLTGSPSRVATYSIALLYSPRFPELLWRNAVQTGFCQNGPLAKALDFPSELFNVRVETSHLFDPQKKWSFNVKCN